MSLLETVSINETMKAVVELEKMNTIVAHSHPMDEYTRRQEIMLAYGFLLAQYKGDLFYLEQLGEFQDPHWMKLMKPVLKNKIEVVQACIQEILQEIVAKEETFEAYFTTETVHDGIVQELAKAEGLEIPFGYHVYLTVPELMDELLVYTDEPIEASALVQLASAKFGVEAEQVVGSLVPSDDAEAICDIIGVSMVIEHLGNIFDETDPMDEVDSEWLVAFTEEEKAVYGETPSRERILTSWEHNKEYFYQHRHLPPLSIVQVTNSQAK